MPEHAIRFGVFDVQGLRSATWKCWSWSGQEDVYVSCRELRGELKVSLHESGAWHVAYDGRFFNAKVRAEDKTEKGRFIDKWRAPAPLAPGVQLALRIVTPWGSVCQPDNDVTEMVRVAKPPSGKAMEFDLFIIEPTTQVTGWPGKNKNNTSLVGSYALPSGRTVWVVSWEVSMPALPKQTGRLRFFDGKTLEDLHGDGLRALALSDEPDGSKSIYDLKIAYEGESGACD